MNFVVNYELHIAGGYVSITIMKQPRAGFIYTNYYADARTRHSMLHGLVGSTIIVW